MSVGGFERFGAGATIFDLVKAASMGFLTFA
jgi:hypothetical protein